MNTPRRSARIAAKMITSPVTSVPLRRSARIAARTASKMNQIKDFCSCSHSYLKIKIFVNTLNASTCRNDRILIFTDMFKYMITDSARGLLLNHPKFRNTVTNKLVKLENEVKSFTLDDDTRNNFMNSLVFLRKHIIKIEKSSACVF